jgi:hypothetical protein
MARYGPRTASNYPPQRRSAYTAPYDEGKEHFVQIDMGAPVTISMVRIWNYNKSRAHAYRGVRSLRLSLDERVVFEGEIRMAPGQLVDVDDCNEVCHHNIPA